MDARIVVGLPENFDADLQTFYHKVLAKELGTPDAIHIRHALREVTRAYKKETVDSYASSIRFDSAEKRCAYVMKHCPCFTSAVTKHFSHLLRSDVCMLREAVCRRRINLCCLGGGPATEAVGVAWVVNALNNAILVKDASRLMLKVRVVDLSEEWRTTTRHVIETLSEDGDFCNSEKMTVDLEFLGADLTEPWGRSLGEWLSEADVVTTVYFVSAVNGSRARNKCLQMLQNIMDALKPGAVFFFLDSAKDIHFKTVSEAVAGSSKDMRRVYGPSLQCFHTLSMASIRRHIELYFDAFGAILCLTHCFVTCCGWVKGRAAGDHQHYATPGKVGRRWEKRVARNTGRMERYRERVERLLMAQLDLDFATDDLCEVEVPPEPEWPLAERRVYNAAKGKRKRIYAWRE